MVCATCVPRVSRVGSGGLGRSHGRLRVLLHSRRCCANRSARCCTLVPPERRLRAQLPAAPPRRSRPCRARCLDRRRAWRYAAPLAPFAASPGSSRPEHRETDLRARAPWPIAAALAPAPASTARADTESSMRAKAWPARTWSPTLTEIDSDRAVLLERQHRLFEWRHLTVERHVGCDVLPRR